MVRSLIRSCLPCLLAAAFLVIGCGPASSIEPGVPKNPQVPVNPTPDMAPNPPPTKA